MEEFVRTIITNWQISLIVGLAGVFLARLFLYVTMVVLGFFVGSYMLFPMALEKIEVLKEWITDQSKQNIAFWAFGIVGALGMTILYKVALFVVGFLVTGFAAYFLYIYADQTFNISQYITFMDPELFRIAVIAVVGAIGGFFFSSKEHVISKWMSVGVGSVITSISLIHVYNLYIAGLNTEESLKFILSQTGLYAIVGIFFVFLVIGYLIHRNRSKEK